MIMADEKPDLNATAESAGGCVLTFQRWRRLSIFHLAACDVDHQLGELRWIAGAFESVLCRGSINDHVDAVCDHDRNEG
jgi:hypothetical protein